MENRLHSRIDRSNSTTEQVDRKAKAGLVGNLLSVGTGFSTEDKRLHNRNQRLESTGFDRVKDSRRNQNTSIDGEVTVELRVNRKRVDQGEKPSRGRYESTG